MRPYTIQTREGEAVSPMTSTRTVFDENGVDLDTLLAQQKQDTANTFKEYAKKTEVTQSLDKKQDKLSTTSELLITPDNIIGLTDRGRRAVFDDMYRTAARQYGSIDYTHVEDGVSKPYQLNGLWLTYEEAVKVMDAGRLCADVSYTFFATAKIRTNMPSYPGQWISPKGELTFYLCPYLEVANIHGGIDGGTLTFGSCRSLREIIGGRVNSPGGNTFQSCPSLESVMIALPSNKKISTSLESSPRLNYASLDYMVTNKQTAEYQSTVTVHPDVYAKLTGDTTNAACAALTDEEREQWVALMERAASKNIIFARP